MKEEDEEDENDENDDEEEEVERRNEGMAGATKSAYRQAGPTSLTLAGGPFSDKHGDSARRSLVAKVSPGESETGSSGSRPRGEDDASDELDVSASDGGNSRSRSMPLNDRGGAVADHSKHRTLDEEHSTASTPPASPPATSPMVSPRSNSGSGDGGRRNVDDTSSQTSGSWTSRSDDSRSSEQSARSTPSSSRGRGAPDRRMAERGRPSRAAAAVAAAAAAAEAAAGAKAAVVELVPNGDNYSEVL